MLYGFNPYLLIGAQVHGVFVRTISRRGFDPVVDVLNDFKLCAMQVKGVHPGRVVAFGVFNEESGTEEVVLVAEVDTDSPDERARIGEEIRQTVTRGSAIALRHVYLVGHKWLIKTSSGKNARLANKQKFLREYSQQI